MAPTFDNDAYLRLLQAQRDAQQAQLDAKYGAYNAQLGLIPAQQGLLGYQDTASIANANARLTQLSGNNAVIQARMGLLPIKRQQIDAQGRVIDASQSQLGAERGLINLEQNQLGAENADIQAIRAARANTADKVAVAQEQQYRDTTDRLIEGALGVSAPINVDVAPGAPTTLGLGQRASLKTQEDIVRGKVADRTQDRAQTLKGAQLAVQLSGTNVTEAELAARRVGLTLNEAELMVEDAQNRADMASNSAQTGAVNAGLEADLQGNKVRSQQLDASRYGIQADLAGLDLARANLDVSNMKSPADQGFQLYTDPVTLQREWLTPQEADQRQFQYEMGLRYARLPEQTQYNTTSQEYATRAEAAKSPLIFMNDTDMANYLIANNFTSYDSWQVNKPVEAIREAIQAKYPGASPQYIDSKVRDIMNAAQRAIARARDEANGGSTPQPQRPGAR